MNTIAMKIFVIVNETNSVREWTAYIWNEELGENSKKKEEIETDHKRLNQHTKRASWQQLHRVTTSSNFSYTWRLLLLLPQVEHCKRTIPVATTIPYNLHDVVCTPFECIARSLFLHMNARRCGRCFCRILYSTHTHLWSLNANTYRGSGIILHIGMKLTMWVALFVLVLGTISYYILLLSAGASGTYTVPILFYSHTVVSESTISRHFDLPFNLFYVIHCK